MNSQGQEHDLHLREKTENDGILVWDKKGLVVRWQDGHLSRFSWSKLRQACLCDECHTASEEKATLVKNFPKRLPHSLEELRRPLH